MRGLILDLPSQNYGCLVREVSCDRGDAGELFLL